MGEIYTALDIVDLGVELMKSRVNVAIDAGILQLLIDSRGTNGRNSVTAQRSQS